MSRCCLLLAAVLIEVARAEVLSSFVRHYEPLHYDQHDLMWHHHRVRRSLVGPRDISLQFTAFNRDFDLRLHPEKNIFSPKMKVIINGKEKKNHRMKTFIYSGTANGDPRVRVHGNLVDGVFHGTIFTSDEVYHIEPASRYFNDSSFHSVIYRSQDLDTSTVSGATCGSTHKEIRKNLLKFQKSFAPLNDDKTEGHLLKKRQSGIRNPNKVRCWLKVVGDLKYYNALRGTRTGNEADTFVGAQLTSTVLQANRIFERIDFDGMNGADGVHFGILEMVIQNDPSDESDSFFLSDFIGVQAFLDRHSREDFSEFCLSYRFTNRDFDGGVVGLAYVAPQPNENFPGGICEDFKNGQTFNSGVVTILNYGAQVPSLLTSLTFAHEAGHNFGSNHDGEAVPDGGAFIMHPFSTNGQEPNNMMFSQRSINEMSGPVFSRGQDVSTGCFVEADNLCGNNIIDEGEDCDCGRNFDENTMMCMDDACCNGRNCTLSSIAACSPDEGPCCTTNCQFVETSDKLTCSVATECAQRQICNGLSAQCPDPDPMVPPPGEDFILCNDDSNTCVNGTCTGSICVTIGLESCNCIGDLACHVCCLLDNGTCASTIAIAAENTNNLRDSLPNRMGSFLEVGFPCGNFTGYCDFFNRCMIVEEEGALSRLANLFFNSEGFQLAIQWIRDMWWAVLLIGIGILVGMFVIVLIFHLILPRPEHVKKRAERRRTIRRSRKQPQRVEVAAPPYNTMGSNYPQNYPEYYYY